MSNYIEKLRKLSQIRLYNTEIEMHERELSKFPWYVFRQRKKNT